MIWLYDQDCDEYIKDDVLDSLHKAHEKDIEIKVGNGADPNMKLKKRKYLQKKCKELLSIMHILKSNCPIVAQKITFAVFSTYLDKRQKGKASNNNDDDKEVTLNESNSHQVESSKRKINIYQEAHTMATAVHGITW